MTWPHRTRRLSRVADCVWASGHPRRVGDRPPYRHKRRRPDGGEEPHVGANGDVEGLGAERRWSNPSQSNRGGRMTSALEAPDTRWRGSHAPQTRATASGAHHPPGATGWRGRSIPQNTASVRHRQPGTDIRRSTTSRGYGGDDRPVKSRFVMRSIWSRRCGYSFMPLLRSGSRSILPIRAAIISSSSRCGMSEPGNGSGMSKPSPSRRGIK